MQYEQASLPELKAVGSWDAFVRYAQQWMKRSKHSIGEKSEVNGLAAEYLMQSMLQAYVRSQVPNEQVIRFWDNADPVPDGYSLRPLSECNWSLEDETQGKTMTEFDSILIEKSFRTDGAPRLYCIDSTTSSAYYSARKMRKQAKAMRPFVRAMQRQYNQRVHQVLFQMPYSQDSAEHEQSRMREYGMHSVSFLQGACGKAVEAIAGSILSQIPLKQTLDAKRGRS
ncbi:MAG: hypothetical protein ABL890_01305 [Candidatus Peribacteraceae bacterium]